MDDPLSNLKERLIDTISVEEFTQARSRGKYAVIFPTNKIGYSLYFSDKDCLGFMMSSKSHGTCKVVEIDPNEKILWVEC